MASKAKTALLNAFLQLIETETYDKITVTRLVEVCGISRQTFYYHFEDIEQMLRWTFEKETAKICDHQVVGNWSDSAKAYIGFLNKYDQLIRKAAQSVHFSFIFDLLYHSFETYMFSYVEKEQNCKSLLNKNNTFLVSILAGAFSGLVLKEIEKPESDYEELLRKIVTAFNVMPQ